MLRNTSYRSDHFGSRWWSSDDSLDVWCRAHIPWSLPPQWERPMVHSRQYPVRRPSNRRYRRLTLNPVRTTPVLFESWWIPHRYSPCVAAVRYNSSSVSGSGNKCCRQLISIWRPSAIKKIANCSGFVEVSNHSNSIGETIVPPRIGRQVISAVLTWRNLCQLLAQSEDNQLQRQHYHILLLSGNHFCSYTRETIFVHIQFSKSYEHSLSLSLLCCLSTAWTYSDST